MKKNLFILLLVSSLLLGARCGPEPPEPPRPNPNPKTKLSIVWHIPFHSDSMEYYFVDPMLVQDYLVLPNQFGNNEGYKPGVGVFHKLTGKRHAAWLSEPGGILDNNDRLDDCKLGGTHHNIIFITGSKNLYAFDLNTKQRLWKSTQPSGWSTESRFSIVAGNPTLSHSFSDGTRSKLARFNTQFGVREDIIELLSEGGGDRIFIRPPAYYIINNGDTLLLFAASGWNFSLGKTNFKVYCYNLTQREMVWTKTNFSTDNNGAGYDVPIITNEQNVIIVGLSSIHCFKIATGELLWQHEMFQVDDFGQTPPLYSNGKIYLRGGYGHIYCYDAATGAELWSNKTLGAIPAPHGRMDIYDGCLYFTGWRGSGAIGLYCVSAHTGQLKWFDTGPNGRISFGVIADQKTGYLYCHSGIFVMCVDLRKTPVND